MANSECDAVGTDATRGRGKPCMKEVAACFHLPIEVAAKKLGVGQTWLKLLCRSNGVSRWPFRKIQSLQNSLDRSKKMQSLVEVAKVINKNLPKWLDLDNDSTHTRARDDLEGKVLQGRDDVEEEQHTEEDVEEAQASGRSVQPLHETYKPKASTNPGWQLPPKKDEGYKLQIKLLRQDSASPSPAASPPVSPLPRRASLDFGAVARQCQWQRVLQDALARQTETNIQTEPTGFGSKTGAFRPVQPTKSPPQPVRIPAPLDLNAFFRTQPMQLMPFYQDQIPTAIAAAYASQAHAYNQYALGSAAGLEQLIAAAAAQPAVPHEQLANFRQS